MQFLNIYLAVASLTSIVTSAPFKLQDGSLQQSRRRAVDYPIHARANRARAHKRSVPYSVVQVDGGSTSAPNVAPQTVVETVVHTEPAVTITTSPSTETVVYTKTLTHAMSDETIVVTEVRKVFTQTPDETATVVKTVVATPSPTSTKYYDNGQWHTSYAVKNFGYPGSGSTSTVPAEPSPTGDNLYGYYGPYKYNSPSGRKAKRNAEPNTEGAKHVLTRTEMKGLKKFMVS